MSWRTALFDLDGTISDPFEGIFKSINYALAAYGYEPAEVSQVRTMIGPPLDEIFTSILGLREEQHVSELIHSYRDRYASVGYAENILYDEIPEVVQRIHQLGYRLGVCTSKRADYAAKIVDMFGLGQYFDFVDGGDIHVRKYMQIERLVDQGVDAATTVMIGDRAVDIDAAKRNDVAAIGVLWGFGDRAELENAGAEHIVASPQELLELLT